MTSILTLFLAGGVIALGTAAIWQHPRYLRVRRERVEDRQPLLYAGATFHTMTLLKVEAAEGREGEVEQRFAQFVAVYYPGIDHMHAMIGSAFMNRIGPGKQLADTLAIVTIPVLSQLDGAAK